MSKKTPDLHCPKCHKPIGFLDQIAEWVETMQGFEDEPTDITPPALVNLWCEACQDMTTSFYWEENDEGEEIEVPALRAVMDGVDRLVINKPLRQKHEQA